MIFSTEKLLKDNGDKIKDETKTKVEEAITKLKAALEGDDIEALKKETEAFQEVVHSVSGELYQADGAPDPAAAGADAAQEQSADDDVVDADYTEVKEDDK